jgi:predicted amino acid dehydrogenase
MALMRRFALVGHARDLRHAYEELRRKVIEPEPYSESYSARLIEQAEPHIADFWGPYPDPDRGPLSGVHVIIPICAEFIRSRPAASREKVARAVAAAAAAGAAVVTLGGLTSVLFRGRQEAAARHYGVAITSGNTLTAAVTVKGVERAAAACGLELGRCTLAVLGASGDIGMGCCFAFHGRTRRLTLAGRNPARLSRLQARLGGGVGGGRAAVSTDIREAVRDADLVIAATSTPNLPLDRCHFKAGAVVCDVGYPRNINRQSCVGHGLRVFDGGLVAPPRPLPSRCDTGLANSSVCYGCYAEGIVLALEGRTSNYSSGRGNITPEKMGHILSLAAKHGFGEVAPFPEASHAGRGAVGDGPL